jgi:hypothetical protein
MQDKPPRDWGDTVVTWTTIAVLIYLAYRLFC